jgi:hypothetical protein
MLDVHPAHHAATTWKDFFIHIATIVIGLLIAICLEQTVEYLHHRHLARHAREALLSERDTNERSNNLNIYATVRHQRDLQHDLAMIHAAREHQPLPPGPFMLRHLRYYYLEDEWQKIHLSGVVNYLTENLTPVDYRYKNQEAFMARVDESNKALYRAGAVLRTEHDPLDNTFDANVADAAFGAKLSASNETLSEDEVARGFAPSAERGDLTRLTPAQLDELQRAVQIALADDDALLAYCYNIKRNLNRNPAP